MKLTAKQGPVAVAVYAGVRVIFTLMQMFPLEWNLGTARLLSRIWRTVLPRHRDRAVAHLRLAYGDQLSEKECRRLANRCLASLAMFAVEVASLPRLINLTNWHRRIVLRDFEEALRALTDTKGAILVTGHYGSFELVGHLLAALGLDMVAVMRPLDNPHLNRYLVQSRRRHGLQLVNKRGATEQAEEILGRGGALAFIGDQDAGRKGMFVDFFGQPASTYKSIGLLAITCEVPVIVGYARRLGDTARYEVGATRVIQPSEWADEADPLRFVTQEYTRAIETFVREDPEQYLWIHRRWKSEPRRGGKRAAKAAGGGTP